MSQKIVEQWIKEPHNDYEMGEILLETKKYNGAVFYSHQGTEKALKSLWYFYDLQPWGSFDFKINGEI